MQSPRGRAAIPSLFADDAAPREHALPPGLLAELEGRDDARRRSPAGRVAGLWRPSWRVAGTTFVLLALALAWFLPDWRPTTGLTSVEAGAPQAPSDAPVSPPAQSAVILDDPPPPRVLAADARDASGEEAQADPMELLREAPVPAPVARRRPARRTDSDVDLLATLMQHAGRSGAGVVAASGDPEAGRAPARPDAFVGVAGSAGETVSRALATCPAANTDAGLACRHAACDGRWGEHPACPRPTVLAAPSQ